MEIQALLIPLMALTKTQHQQKKIGFDNSCTENQSANIYWEPIQIKCYTSKPK